jgi:hypothetical protein
MLILGFNFSLSIEDVKSSAFFFISICIMYISDILHLKAKKMEEWKILFEERKNILILKSS